MLPFKITKETKLSIFQYKIIHNILPHGVLLHKMKLINWLAVREDGVIPLDT
jgi:hypothetical protein